MLLQGVGLPFYIRWEVVRMKFDFKDLMAFGMFILALRGRKFFCVFKIGSSIQLELDM